MANLFFPVLLYLLFFLLPSPSLSLNFSSPVNTTLGLYNSLYFPSFNNSLMNTILTIFPSATIASNSLQVTPDSLNNADYLIDKAGRIFITKPFTLWENTSSGTRVASFYTAFDINIFRTNSSPPGEGFAFLIASSLESPPPGSGNGYLGLTNQTRDGDASNKFVAIELDTVKQSYDPDDNHIGLDINGVNSTAVNSLTPFGIEIAPVNATNYTLWVDYNGSTRHISVYMAKRGSSKPTKFVLNATLDLSEVINQEAYIGFSASTGVRYQLNCVLEWVLMVEKLREEKAGLSKLAIAVIIGVSCSISAIVALVLLAFYIRRKRVKDDPAMLTGTLRSLPGMPREFDFKALKKATDNFDEKMKLGQGGFGVVYKGVLVGENGEGDMVVAVKQFSRANTKGQEDFLQELSIINRLRHKHLVRLVGWCHRNCKFTLVYDFMPNGSLDQHLYGGPDKPILTWDRRYNIITGVASALQYLHNEYDQMVVHRDLKASNVMLDAAFNARLGDFGLARALEIDKTSYAELEVQGTMGYIAPECFHMGKATRESDVYGFGATILETVCGRRPRCDIAGFHFLVDWVWKLYREGRILEAVDSRLTGTFNEADADRLLRLGLMCSHPDSRERPKTQAIVQILSRSVPPPEVPPFKPAIFIPAPEPESDSSRLNSSGVTSSYTVSTSEGYTYSSYYASREHLENDRSLG
ncbi:putative L-type lectin-domain containing receptor kinase S.5 [Carex littledalei]|uniref:Putative L-type lectin-domain containing receptor kinase S.5 n=1 Tax=Carex littledalei TaxID=544730 RepID=A0A833RP37_9POAL|nr:putative L-type lectin-domain containing receptor kinase S.5 [Carex littledalei]